MAIYHLSVKPISRASGRSATAAIAYRSGERVHDLSTGETFDYTRKRGVEHSEIVLPDSAAKRDINWARDRQALWNAAESAEKRKDARVAREYELALPHEMTRAQRVELVRGFAGELANRYGVAVDFAIHRPHRSGDERNFHAHVLTTTRAVEPAGLGAKASIEWSDTDRAKKGLGPAKAEVKAIRARWEEFTNERLRELGIEARIDHRSLADQGQDREPGRHLGPAVSGMERRGIATEVGKRIGWEMQAAASERLARAAELGRLERETAEIQKSILDVSGSLQRALADRQRGSAEKPNLDARQQQAVERWKALRLAETAQVQERDAALAPLVEPVATPIARGLKTERFEAWRKDMAARPLEHQAQIVEALEKRLSADRRSRLERVLGRGQVRAQRRLEQERKVGRERPVEPKGVFGALRRRAYEQALGEWQRRYSQASALNSAAIRTNQQLYGAMDSMPLRQHAQRVIARVDPQLLQGVQAFKRTQSLPVEQEREKQRAQSRSLDKDWDLGL